MQMVANARRIIRLVASRGGVFYVQMAHTLDKLSFPPAWRRIRSVRQFQESVAFISHSAVFIAKLKQRHLFHEASKAALGGA